MAGWYIRRGEKIAGPITVEKLKAGLAEGKMLPTDEVAKDPAGPWTPVRKTSLMKSASQVPAIAVRQPVPEVQPPPPPSPPNPSKLAAAAQGFSAMMESRAQRKEAAAQRKHELKLEEMRVRAAAATSRPANPPPPPQHSPSPSSHHTTVIVQQSGGQGLAAVINFFFPPFGYLIQGRFFAFLAFWFLFAIAVVFGVLTAGVGLLIAGPALWILCIIDAANYRPKR